MKETVDILALVRERAGDYDCPVCRRSLAGCRLSLVKDQRPTYTVEVECPRCKVSFLVVLEVRDHRTRRDPDGRDGPVDTPTATVPAAVGWTAPWREASEVVERATQAPIAADEVLDLHRALHRARSLRALVDPAAR